MNVQDFSKELRVEFGKNGHANSLKLPINRDIDFLVDDIEDYHHENLVFDIYFPNSKRIVPLKLCNLLP